MIDKADVFNISLGVKEYETHETKYQKDIPWESLANDMKELFMYKGYIKHKQTTVAYFNASKVQRTNYLKNENRP